MPRVGSILWGLRRVAVDPPRPSGSCCRAVTRHNPGQRATRDPVVIRCWLQNFLTRAAKHVPELRVIDDCCAFVRHITSVPSAHTVKDLKNKIYCAPDVNPTQQFPVRILLSWMSLSTQQRQFPLTCSWSGRLTQDQGTTEISETERYTLFDCSKDFHPYS